MFDDTMKAERKRRGWKQQELAQRSGLAQGYLTSLENGKRVNPGVDTLQKLARAFALTADQLLSGISRIEESSPADTLHAEGLPEAEVARIGRLWEEYPDKRKTLLETAHNLAQVQAKLNRIAASLRAPKGDP